MHKVHMFGLPPRYHPIVDLNGRIYNKLWGNKTDYHFSKDKLKTISGDRETPEESSVSTTLYGIKFRIGSSSRVRMGLLSTVFNSLNNIGDLDNTIERVQSDWNSKVNSGLNTFKFGSALRNGENSYLKIVEVILTAMAYGEKVNKVPDHKNPYLDRSLYLHDDLDILFPEFIVAASSETSITETASTDVGDSLLTNLLNKGSMIAREMNFVNGGSFSIASEINGLKDSIGGDENGFLKTVLGGLSTGLAQGRALAEKIIGRDMVNIIADGNQLMLPKVWKGSSFSKSYSISIRLNSPYSDPYSIAKNINIPLAYILAATLPIQKSPNSVSFPFLIQVDSPGAISIDMGMVTNVTIKKGGKEDVWSNTGLYRSLDITLEVVDLYGTIPIPANEKLLAFNNTSRELFANMAGGVLLSDSKSRNNILEQTQESFKRQKDDNSNATRVKKELRHKESTSGLKTKSLSERLVGLAKNTTPLIESQLDELIGKKIKEGLDG